MARKGRRAEDSCALSLTVPGSPIAMGTAKELRISEIFESIQGEGASAGEPCVFVRLATCNLRCVWCDTKYTWDWDQYRYSDEVRHMTVGDVATEVRKRARGRVVVTGGEPLLQEAALSALLLALPRNLAIEIETNGTLAPGPALGERVDQWNVSPKLANSGESEERRLHDGALAALRDTGRAWLKLVVGSDADGAEADALVTRLSWPRERVLFMPLAANRAELRERTPLVLRIATARGVGVSPRLHVEKWDGRRGV